MGKKDNARRRNARNIGPKCWIGGDQYPKKRNSSNGVKAGGFKKEARGDYRRYGKSCR